MSGWLAIVNPAAGRRGEADAALRVLRRARGRVFTLVGGLGLLTLARRLRRKE